MKKIRFIAQGSNTAIGGFTAGDIARIDAALAKHLVEGIGVAEYFEPEVGETEKVTPNKAKSGGK